MTNTLNGNNLDFQRTLDELFLEKGDKGMLQKIKVQAFDQFKAIGLPTKKQEAFRYVPLRKFFEKQYQSSSFKPEISLETVYKFVLPECQNSFIVLVNGRYSKELSDTTKVSARVVISSLNEAMHTYSSFLTNHFAKTLKNETDPFAALNAALQNEGIFIYLPPKTVLEKPIQILHLIDTQNEALVLNPRLQVFVGAQSSVECVLTHEFLSIGDHFINHVSDFAIEEDSHVRLNCMITKKSDDFFHFEATRAILKKNSTFESISFSNGSLSIRRDYKMTLIGENAECALNNLWMLKDNNEQHYHILIDHQAPNCRSRQLFKGALDDFSKSSFEGKILVKQAAQKTDAFQLNANLLLSDHTMAFSKPNLEIFADDVKASHGATFGQLDQEQLFCLRSRGISEFEAKNLLLFGFCKEVIDLITIESLKTMLVEQAKTFGKEIKDG